MKIDIDTTFKVILLLLAAGIITTISMAWKSLAIARRLDFFRKRQLINYGWRMVFVAFLLTAGGYLFFRFGEPIAYHYFPPSPTVTRTPTLTTTPTITQTLQNTLTPTITPTLIYTYTPMLPDVVQTAIQTPVDPYTDGLFSPVNFSTQLKDKVPKNTTNTFTLPISQMYAGFSYDKMTNGIRWSAVWLHEGKVMCYETLLWDGGSGGSGYSDACNNQLTPDQWLPGKWEVQIFLGQTWKSSGKFTVLGNAATPGTSTSPTLTPNSSITTKTPFAVTLP